MNEQVYFLKYVGKAPRKTDNVCRSGITWEGPGDVRPVPVATALRLLQHQDVWADVSAELSLSDRREVSKGTPPAPPSARGREEMIYMAIMQLDPGNPEHFGRNSGPKTSAIRQVTGFEVSSEERSAVWQKILRDREKADMGVIGRSPGESALEFLTEA